MGCKNCFNGCGTILGDGCVQYSGEDIPLLDVCNGEPITKLHEAIVEKLLSALDGTGITPSEVTLANCEYIKEALDGKDPTLTNLLQVLIDTQCTFNQAISDLQETDETFIFDIKCLTGLPTSPSRDNIIQGIINKLCSINTTVNNFATTYVKQADLETKVITIIEDKTSASTQYYNRAIPFVAYEYYGPLSNFDNTGKGIAGQGYDKMFLCNGLNGTPDRRGRTAVGAIANVPGAALDAGVDPNNPNNPNTNYALKDKFGENFHKLTLAELPAHTHKVNDPGHTHDYEGFDWENRPGGNNVRRMDNPLGKVTSRAFTGITIDGAGGDVPHNNRQPSIAAYYIMYIP